MNKTSVFNIKIDFDKIKWGTFTKAFEKFKRREPTTPLKNLKEFAEYIIKHKEDASDKLLKKARFYLNVLV